MGKKKEVVLPPRLPPDFPCDETEVSDENLDFVAENIQHVGFLTTSHTSDNREGKRKRLEEDEERWKKSKEGQEKRLEESEEQIVKEKSYLEDIAERHKIKLGLHNQDLFDQQGNTTPNLVCGASKKIVSPQLKFAGDTTPNLVCGASKVIIRPQLKFAGNMTPALNVVAENGVGLLETKAEELRVKRNEQMRQKYRENKLQSGIQSEPAIQREERNKKRRQRYHGETTEQRE